MYLALVSPYTWLQPSYIEFHRLYKPHSHPPLRLNVKRNRTLLSETVRVRINLPRLVKLKHTVQIPLMHIYFVPALHLVPSLTAASNFTYTLSLLRQ